MDAKLTAAIQITHVIVQCKVIAYAVLIANVIPTFVKKQLKICNWISSNTNFLFFD